MRDVTREPEAEASSPQRAAEPDSSGGGNPAADLQSTAGNAATAQLMGGGGGGTAELTMPGPAPTAHQQDAVARVAALHTAAMSRFSASVDAALATLEAAVREQQQAVDTALAGEVGTAGSRATAARTGVQSAADGEQAALTPAAALHHAELDAWQTGAVAAATGDLALRQEQLHAAGRDRAAQSRAEADAAATTVQAEATQQVGVARATGNSAAASASGDEQPVREAQASAAHEITDDTTAKITTGANEGAATMRAQGEEVAGALETGAEGLAGGLLPHHVAIVSHLTEQGAQGATAVTGVATQAEQALGQQRDAATAAIGRTETDAVAALRRQAADRRAALEHLAEQAAALLRRAADEASRALTGQLSEATAMMVAQPVDEEAAADFAEAAGEHLNAAVDQLGGDMTRWAGEGSQQLVAAQADAATALSGTTERAAAALDHAHDSSAAAVRQTGTGAREGMAATVQGSQAAGAVAATQFGTTLDAQVTSATPSLDGLVTEHGVRLGDLTSQVRAPITDAAGTHHDRVSTAQSRAAERAERSWISNQMSDLWDMVTSPEFLVGLVVGLLVAAIIIGTAGTATPFVIMAAGIAAGAAGAAAGTVTGNAIHGRDLTENLVRNTLIGAAAGGVAAGVYLFGAGMVTGLGLTGTAAAVGGFVVLEVSAVAANTVGNLLAGEPWDKNLIAAMLLAPLVQRLASRIPGLRGRPPLEEIDPTVPRVGEWTFTTEVLETLPDGTRVVRVEARLPDGRFAEVERGYNPNSGEFQDRVVNLSQIPEPMRFVEVNGQRVPLNDYLSMRVMRQLQVPVATLRTVRVVEVQNVRSVLQLRSGVAPAELQLSRADSRAVTRAGGGRVIEARIVGGRQMPLSELLEIWEGSTPPEDMVAAHNTVLQEFNITREQAPNISVLSDFDIVLTIEPPLQPVMPVPRTDHGTDDGGTDGGSGADAGVDAGSHDAGD